MSQPRRSLDPLLVQAVSEAVRARLPTGEPLTLDALEDTVLGVLQELGPAVAQELAAPQTGPQKRGHRRAAAGGQSAGSAGRRGTS